DDGKSQPSAVSRDYSFDVDDASGRPPLLSVLGGKITTYRKLAEQAVDRLVRYFGSVGPAWTATATLPGGDIPDGDPNAFARGLRQMRPWLPVELADRYAHAYGTLSDVLLAGASDIDGLGREVAPGLFEAELQYLVDREWARTAEDVLWRRSKLGVGMTDQAIAAVQDWLDGGSSETDLDARRRTVISHAYQ